MNNPNHPLYNALGGNSNIHLLDNMLFSSDQHKTTLIPQYAYPVDGLTAHQLHLPQHAMNLAMSGQSHSYVVAAVASAVNSASVAAAASTIDTSALLYQQQQQQQNNHHHQQQQHQQQPISYRIPQQQQQQQQQTQQQQQQIQQQKKDIVAQAFEEISRTPEVKKAPEVSSPPGRKSPPPATPSTSSASVSNVKVEPSSQTPVRSGPTPRGRGRGSSSAIVNATKSPFRQQQVMPRLTLLEDEDDGLTCRMCLQPFWYKTELTDHLRTAHSISDPDRYEREEREKKIRRIREEQQRIALAKQQRLGLSSSLGRPGPASATIGRGSGVSVGLGRGRGSITTGRGRGVSGGRPQIAGPRPSFQYRDGAFICDLCKKSFSDGNDMVAHWKLHVKQQQVSGSDERKLETPKRGRGRGASITTSAARGSNRGFSRGASKTHTTSRGRPITKKQAGRRGRGRGAKRAGRSDKGKPRWTAYLVWSTRRRKAIANETGNASFTQVAKQISEEWKAIPKDELEALKEEAERLNASGVKKLPRSQDSEEETDSSEAEDPTFYKSKKIKTGEDDDYEPGDDISAVTASSGPRSGRKRKRPSFFQEFENEEDNLDKILDEFEQEQLAEAANPKPKKVVKNPGSRPRRPKREVLEDQEPEDEEAVELETTRSGRVRKKKKVYSFPAVEGEEEEEEDDGDDEPDEYEPESEQEEEEEEDHDEEEEEATGEDGRKIALPPRKRRRSSGANSSSMTEKDIKRATLAALAAKPIVIGLKGRITTSGNSGCHEGDAVNKSNDNMDEEQQQDEEEASLNTPKPSQAEDEDPIGGADGDNNLEGSVTDEPPENMFGEDDEDEDQAQPQSEQEQQQVEQDDGQQEAEQDEEQQQAEQEEEQQQIEQSQQETEEPSVEANQAEENFEGQNEVDPFESAENENQVSEDAPQQPAEIEEELNEADIPEEEPAPEESAPVINEPPMSIDPVDDLLGPVGETNSMEAGDEEYKQIIAESQMDNIFN